MIGQLCHHFSWTYDYATKEIDWHIIQRMLIDAPSYDSDKKEKEIDLTEMSADDIEGMLSKYK